MSTNVYFRNVIFGFLIITFVGSYSFMFSQSKHTPSSKLNKTSINKLNSQISNPSKVKFPITVAKFTSLFGKYLSRDDLFYYWNLPNGIEVSARDGAKHSLIQIYVYTENNAVIINDCIYGLSINKSSLQECKKQFMGSLKKSNDLAKDFNIYKIYGNGIWTYLYFSNDVLRQICIADWEYDPTVY